MLQEWVDQQYAQIAQELLPPIHAFVERLDVPAWSAWQTAAGDCWRDLVQSSHSASRLAYLTGKPFAILLWILLQALGRLAHVAFQVLLEQAWISTKKGAVQLQHGSILFYKFQRGLSRRQIAMEAVAVGILVGMYYLRKWLKRQTYYSRAMKYIGAKKRRAVQSYKKTVHRVAKVSYVLALTMPHLAFLGAAVAFKLLLPRVFSWLAYETYVTELLSVAYPWVATLIWVHECRHGWSTGGDTKENNSNSSVKQKAFNFERTSAKNSRNSIEDTPGRRGKTTRKPLSPRKSTNSARSGVFPKTTPAAVQSKSRRKSFLRTPPVSPSSITSQTDPNLATQYWLQYWGVYALVQCFGKCCSMIPVFGRFVARHPFVLSLCCEVRLLFFVWLLCMESLLSGEEVGILQETRPLQLIHDHVTPVMLEFHKWVSEVVSVQTWKSGVEYVRKILDVAVMVHLIGEPTKEWLLHVMEESRTLLIPTVSLLMPGFITQFGVAYVQFVVPAGRAAHARRDQRAEELQYWILHGLVSGLLSYLSGVLWWIPFSTHVTYLLWCHLTLPKTIQTWYQVLEQELMAFGILTSSSTEEKEGSGRRGSLDLHETKTVQLLSSIAKRLPSASSDTFDEGEKEAKRDDSNLQSSISVDSQRVEVAISPESRLSAAPSADSDDSSDIQTDLPHDESLDSLPPLASKSSTTQEGDDNDDAVSSASSSVVDRVIPTKPLSSAALRRSTRSRGTSSRPSSSSSS